MDLKKLIEDSKEKEIMNDLANGEFEKIISTINKRYECKASFFSKKKDANIPFALSILKAVLQGEIRSTKYSKYAKLDVDKDDIGELLELTRMLYILESNNICKAISLAEILLECIRDGAVYTEKNSNNYPANPLNAKIWMDGAELRIRAGELAMFFSRNNLDKEELEALFLRSKITNSIMSHYPDLVGPDMIAVAKKYEHLGHPDKAINFYTAVFHDFPQFLNEIEEMEKECKKTNEKMEYDEDDIAIITALRDACEGLRRLKKDIDQNILDRAKNQLQKANSN